ncbi:hypothetical protein DNK74_08820 [Klebsiella pneumoniae]|nr:hypothetical protein DNK74_08820 [Klebsiella pneumoniae]
MSLWEDPVGRARRSRHPAKLQEPCLISCPAALRLRGPARYEPVRGPCRPGKATAAIRHKAWSQVR